MTLAPWLLWFAVAVAAGAVVVPAPAAARRLLATAAVALTGSTVLLGSAFIGGDWRYVYVADNARSGAGPLLRMAGVWAGPEGSLLAWTTMTAWVAVVAVRAAPAAARPGAVRAGAALTAAYALVTATVAWPFERLAAPAVDGIGLVPVLEHPAMVWHPPLLYAGLVGMLAPLIVVAGGVLAGSGPGVAGRVIALPLALLTIGLASGSAWAVVELGWGGFWAWDPIETAGLVAWLCGAAALHATVATPDRPGGDGGVVIDGRPGLAVVVAPGVAAIWATTLTRIGVISSVHAFAERPGLRGALIAVAAVASVAVAALVLLVPPPGGATPAGRWVRDRRSAVGALSAAAALVALGTYEPLVEAATAGDVLAIAGTYYTRMLWPLCLVAALLAVRADRSRVAAGLGAAVGLVLVPWAAGPFALVLGAIGGGVAGSSLGAVARSRNHGEAGRRGSGVVAHVGLGVLLVGVAGTVAGRSETVTVIADREVPVAGHTLVHRSIELDDDGQRPVAVATVELDGVTFHPGLVSHTARGLSSVELARRFDGLDEVQVILVDGDADHARYQVNDLPRLGLVWLGAATVTAGAALSALSARRGRRRAATAPVTADGVQR